MIDWYSLSGIIVGLCGIVTLFIARRKYQRLAPNLTDGVVVFLAGYALAAGGVKVCILSLTLPSLKSEREYIFLGGIAVIWVSIEAIWQKIAGP